jgi:hypothetical protein
MKVTRVLKVDREFVCTQISDNEWLRSLAKES